MNEFTAAYCTLISSPAQLAQCREAHSLTALLQVIKTLWNIHSVDDNQLFAELNQLNRKILDDPSVQLAGTWLPYRYHAKSRSIYWCIPDGHATEPFQDESISRYHQKILLNTIIQPRTSLDNLSHQAHRVAKAQPAGFIFHLSRCGSTLVSGCLSELDSTCVLSESPVLTEVLLDRQLDDATQQLYLQNLIDLQASAFHDRPKIIIKWNAWDIFHQKLIRATYPSVPTLFLVRNPVEILASHQRSSGRHMSGDPSLGGVDFVFNGNTATPLPLLDFRIRVLQRLMTEMQLTSTREQDLRLDYRQLNFEQLVDICAFFRIPLSELEAERIRSRLAFHSKFPAQRFHNDSTEKQNLFSSYDMTRMQQSLMPQYHRFIEKL